MPAVREWDNAAQLGPFRDAASASKAPDKDDAVELREIYVNFTGG
jgi:hypothetical protein